jgi:hypothetical protein
MCFSTGWKVVRRGLTLRADSYLQMAMSLQARKPWLVGAENRLAKVGKDTTLNPAPVTPVRSSRSLPMTPMGNA